MRQKVFISHYMPDIGLEMIRQHFEVDYWCGSALSKTEFIARAKDATALVIFMTDFIDAEIIENCSKLKVISSFGKGYDNIDVAACTRQGILVTNNPDDLTASTADLAIALLLALCRNVVSSDAYIRTGKFGGWHPFHFLGSDFHGKTLGLIGFGAIGQAIARRAKGFDVNLYYYDVERKPEAEHILAVQYAPLAKLLANSNFVIIAVNLCENTRHLLSSKEIASLRPGSYLINISRGSTVDEAAVAEALLSGHLRGYAADVFEFEDQVIKQRPDYINEKLLHCTGQTVFTPHIGTGTVDARQQLSVSTAKQLICALKGEKPTGAINYTALMKNTSNASPFFPVT